VWNSLTSSLLRLDVRVGQGAALSSVLSALYITFIFYIFENNSFLIPIPVSILSFVNNGLLMSQEKTSKSNANLFYSYNIIAILLNNFGLKIKHNKLEFSTSPEL